MCTQGISLHPQVGKSVRMGDVGEVTNNEDASDEEEEGEKRVWMRWRV